MAFWVRRLCFGILATVFPVHGVGAQMRSGNEQMRSGNEQIRSGAESQHRAPILPVRVVTAGAQGPLEDELLRMSAQAGIIFAGQVAGIERQPGSVAVAFRVEEAIRGCAAPGTYVLHEWAGLWVGGTERYHVGQRFLMLLHAPGTSGLTSPVGGQDGAIPIFGGGASPGPADEFIGSGEQAVDLRWVEARLSRPAARQTTFRARPVAPVNPVSVGEEKAVLVAYGAAEDPASFEGTDTALGSAGLATARPLRTVLAMLGAWGAGQANAAR